MARKGYNQNIPCGATTTLGRSYRMGFPEGWGNNAVYCLQQLATATSYKESEHVNILSYILYYHNKEKKIQKDKQNKVK